MPRCCAACSASACSGMRLTSSGSAWSPSFISGPSMQPDPHIPEADEIHDAGTTYGAYLWGLALAVLLTLASFSAVVFHWVWAPGMPILLGVLAIAQMGVHLVFFMHVHADEE